MPTKSGRLTAEERNKIVDRLTELAPDSKCHFCGNGNLGVTQMVLILRALDLTTGQPVVPVVCTKCGASYFFSASMLGLSMNPEEWTDDVPPAE